MGMYIANHPNSRVFHRDGDAWFKREGENKRIGNNGQLYTTLAKQLAPDHWGKVFKGRKYAIHGSKIEGLGYIKNWDMLN